jgi:hypothetical protein
MPVAVLEDPLVMIPDAVFIQSAALFCTNLTGRSHRQLITPIALKGACVELHSVPMQGLPLLLGLHN